MNKTKIVATASELLAAMKNSPDIDGLAQALVATATKAGGWQVIIQLGRILEQGAGQERVRLIGEAITRANRKSLEPDPGYAFMNNSVPPGPNLMNTSLKTTPRALEIILAQGQAK